MKKSYAVLCNFSNIKYACKTNFLKNKIIYLILFFLSIFGILTGILVALKCGITSATLGDYNLCYYEAEQLSSFSLFFKRLFSHIIFLFVLSCLSLNVCLVPVGIILITYRTYLAGFNCALLVSMFGVSGGITSLIIILPLQLFATLLFITFFVLMINRAEQRKKIGLGLIKFWKTFFIYLTIFVFLNFLENILLIILNAGAIFVL